MENPTILPDASGRSNIGPIQGLQTQTGKTIIDFAGCGNPSGRTREFGKKSCCMNARRIRAAIATAFPEAPPKARYKSSGNMEGRQTEQEAPQSVSFGTVRTTIGGTGPASCHCPVVSIRSRRAYHHIRNEVPDVSGYPDAIASFPARAGRF